MTNTTKMRQPTSLLMEAKTNRKDHKCVKPYERQTTLTSWTDSAKVSALYSELVTRFGETDRGSYSTPSLSLGDKRQAKM